MSKSLLLVLVLNGLSFFLFSEVSGQSVSRLQCTGIVMAGIKDCFAKFVPKPSLLSDGLDFCCSYRKFNACTAGLRTGLKVSIQQAKCPSSFLSSKQISAMTDRFTGLGLSSCKNDTKKKCSSSNSNKKKVDTKPSSSFGSELTDSLTKPLQGVLSQLPKTLPSFDSLTSSSSLLKQRKTSIPVLGDLLPTE